MCGSQALALLLLDEVRKHALLAQTGVMWLAVVAKPVVV